MAEAVHQQSAAILEFASNGTHAEDQNGALAASLRPAALADSRTRLQSAKGKAEDEIRSISKQVAPDVDGWIEKAKQLQADIERSRDIARTIVEEADQARRVQERRTDAAKKAELLKAETSFFKGLQDTLQKTKAARDQLGEAKRKATEGATYQAYETLDTLEYTLPALGAGGRTNASDLIQQRVEDLRSSIIDQVKHLVIRTVVVSASQRSVDVASQVESQAGQSVSAHDVFNLSSRLGLLDNDVSRICSEIESRIISSLFASDTFSARSSSTEVKSTSFRVIASTPQVSHGNLITDLTKLFTFLKKSIPSPAGDLLGEKLVPSVISFLISQKLPAALPSSLRDSSVIEDIVSQVQQLGDALDSLSWPGSADLKEWSESIAKAWLARRRESSIDTIRSLLAKDLATRKTVEHVETQLISSDDAMVQNETVPTDDWDEEWDEEGTEEKSQFSAPVQQSAGDEDDWGGWDEEQSSSPTKTHAQVNGNSASKTEAEGEEGDGWDDWDDQKPASVPASPALTKKAASQVNGHSLPTRVKSREHEVTLRETYTTTALPDELFASLGSLISDARNLRSPSYASSPIAPAAAAMYTIPSIAISAFRSLGPPAYELLQGGNMLLFNDSNRLAAQLKNLQTQLSEGGDPGLSRLKLDTEIPALESFARRGYSKAMEEQRTVLRDLIDNAQGFAQCTTQPYKSSCDDAIQMTLAHLRSVAELWRTILSRNAWLQALGSLLNTVISKIIIEIEEMSDIGAEESAQLKKYIVEVSQLQELFVVEGRESVGLYVREWFKFQYLAEVLESNLEDIKFLWKEGGLKNEFEMDEVCELVEALFADGDRRRRALNDIRRS